MIILKCRPAVIALFLVVLLCTGFLSLSTSPAKARAMGKYSVSSCPTIDQEPLTSGVINTLYDTQTFSLFRPHFSCAVAERPDTLLISARSLVFTVDGRTIEKHNFVGIFVNAQEDAIPFQNVTISGSDIQYSFPDERGFVGTDQVNKLLNRMLTNAQFPVKTFAVNAFGFYPLTPANHKFLGYEEPMLAITDQGIVS